MTEEFEYGTPEYDREMESLMRHVKYMGIYNKERRANAHETSFDFIDTGWFAFAFTMIFSCGMLGLLFLIIS